MPLVGPVLRGGARGVRLGTRAISRRVHREWVAPLLQRIGELEREVGRLEATAKGAAVSPEAQPTLERDELYIGILAPLPGEETPLPPTPLRYRVTGNRDGDAFLRAGKRSYNDIQQALQTIGRDLDSFSTILDFGCGCGRALRWMPRTANMYGVRYRSRSDRLVSC